MFLGNLSLELQSCLLEFKSTGSRGLGKRLHAPVIFVAGAIESDAFDALLLRLLRNALPDELGGLAIAAVLHLRAHFLLQGRGAGEDFVPGRRRDLSVDVRVGAMHGEAHRSDLADFEPGLPCAAQPRDVFVAHGRYFFFVSFSTTTSLL